MKIQLYLMFFGLIFWSSFQANSDKRRAPYFVGESKFSKKLKPTQSCIDFRFDNLANDTSSKVRYSIDNGKEFSVTLINGKFSVKTKPGKHSFMILYGNEYDEIFINAIELKQQHRLPVSLFLFRTEQRMMVEKPVIYLYPEVKTEVEVVVKPKGFLTFTYPEYKNGWKVSAEPDGTLAFGDKKYNYLFWESNQIIESFDFNDGFIVKAENIVSFLEEKCTKFGFTSQEQADFLTYWGPRLMQHKESLIHFVFNEKCYQFAELKITPKPTNILRFYIICKAANETSIAPKAQEIPIPNRNGFDVLEWGGIEIE